MFFSTVGSVLGYRREIAEERRHLTPLVLTALLGASAGALLLLTSPAEALDVVVPVLIVVALALVVLQKPLTTALRSRSEKRTEHRSAADAAGPEGATGAGASMDGSARSPLRSPALVGSIGAASVYGGYFTAAQGVLYLGILGVFTGRPMGSVNSVKNLLSLCVNLAAALIYVIAFFAVDAQVVWAASCLLYTSPSPRD